MSDAARKLKFLRERDQVTLNRLATSVGLEKDYLRDVEAGRQEMSAQAIWLVAEFFKVKPDYFKTSDHSSARSAEPRGAGGGAGSGRSGTNMDFGEFTYFKEAPPSGDAGESAPGEDSYVGEGSQVILQDTMGDLSDSAPGTAARAAAAQPARPGTGRVKKSAPAPMPAPAPKPAPQAAPRPAAAAPAAPPRPSSTPKPPGRSTAAPTGKQPGAPSPNVRPDPTIPMGHRPIAIDRPVLPSDAASLLQALVDVLEKKGFFTREEFEEALHRRSKE